MFEKFLQKMINKSLLNMAFAGVAAIFLISSTVFPLNQGLAPEAKVRQYFEEWQKIAANGELSETDKNGQFLHVIEELFYIERLSRQFVNKVWKKLSPYDRNRFGEALKKSIVDKIKSSSQFATSNGTRELTLRKKEMNGTNAKLDFDFVDKTGKLEVQAILSKTPAGDWKITNLKMDKNSLVRHYFRFCKKRLDDYSFSYLVAELGEYDFVVLEDFESGSTGNFPPGWSWKSKDNNKHKPYLIKAENKNKYLEARDEGESVIIGKKIKWNLKKYRYISFKWRAHRLPPGGDERYGKTVDSAAGIYFTYKKKLGLIPKSVKFVWSTTLPVGSAMLRNGIGKPWMVVAESGSDHLGEWRTYVFDAYQAYKDTFGGKPPDKPLGIGILSDANSTHSFAYADYDDIRALKNANANSGVKEILDAE